MGNGYAVTGQGLAGYLLLFSALYGGYGALSPFLPAFLAERELAPEEIASLLAAATLVRLVAGPAFGRLADRTGRTRPLLALALAGTAAANLGFLTGNGFVPLLAIGLAQAVATAPISPLADVLALAAARGGRAFEYGWVRAAGSTAFIGGTIASGYWVGKAGISAALWTCGGAFFLASLIATQVRVSERPASEARSTNAEGAADGFAALLALPRFRKILLAAALVIGAHAMHDAFAVIAWRKADIGAWTAGLLWSESVAAEILVFLLIGPLLLRRFGAGNVIALAAIAGAVRWAVQAQTTALPALVAIQALHGLTFAALHLACLASIEACVPEGSRATALTLYGSLALGLASALVTLAAGSLYARFDLQAFWAMSALSLLAVPVARSLSVPSDRKMST